MSLSLDFLDIDLINSNHEIKYENKVSWGKFDVFDDDFEGRNIEVEEEIKSVEKIKSEKDIQFKRDLVKNQTCEKCGNPSIILEPSEGYLYCTDCGYANGEFLDMQHEWRGNIDDSKGSLEFSRVGMPINEHLRNANLSTIILGFGNQSFRRFQIYQSMTYKDRKLLGNFKKIESKTMDSFISDDVAEYAKNAFKKLSDDDKRRGDKLNSDMAACVYFCGIQRENKKTKESIIENFKINQKKFTKGCNHFKEVMFYEETEYFKSLRPNNEYKIIQKYLTGIDIEDIYIKITQYIAFMSVKLNFFHKITPASIACGSILGMAKLYGFNTITKGALSKYCQISEVTIGKSYNKISSYLRILAPTEELMERFIENYDLITY